MEVCGLNLLSVLMLIAEIGVDMSHWPNAKAITATARKLACVVYHLLEYQENYVPLDVTIYERNAAQTRLRRVQREVTELGFELVEKQQAA